MSGVGLCSQFRVRSCSGRNEGEQVSTGLVSVWESSQEKAFLHFFDASVGSL